MKTLLLEPGQSCALKEAEGLGRHYGVSSPYADGDEPGRSISFSH